MTVPHDDARTRDAITALHYTQQASSQVASRAAAKFGIAPADLRVLYFLGVEPGATPKRVAEHSGLTTGAVTSLVDRLVERGYAAREPHPTDRRSVTLVLTASGDEVVTEFTKLYGDAFRASVDPAELRALAAALSAFSASLGDTAKQQREEDGTA